jgi:hypothetical protein
MLSMLASASRRSDGGRGGDRAVGRSLSPVRERYHILRHFITVKGTPMRHAISCLRIGVLTVAALVLAHPAFAQRSSLPSLGPVSSSERSYCYGGRPEKMMYVTKVFTWHVGANSMDLVNAFSSYLRSQHPAPGEVIFTNCPSTNLANFDMEKARQEAVAAMRQRNETVEEITWRYLAGAPTDSAHSHSP